MAEQVMNTGVTKTQLDYLKEISDNTKREPDIQIILNGTSNDFTTDIYPPFKFEQDRWTVGLRNFSTYNSIKNINATNNLFRYSVDSGATWKLITLPPGAYEIDSINGAITDGLTANGDAGITITPNEITFGTNIAITPATYRVDFTIANSLRTILGFDAVILTTGSNDSQHPASIISVSQILVNCNIINNSYLNGSPFPTIFSFPVNVRSGERFDLSPSVIYFPLNSNQISKIRIWLTDQSGNNVPLNIEGAENVTLTLHFRYL